MYIINLFIFRLIEIKRSQTRFQIKIKSVIRGGGRELTIVLYIYWTVDSEHS